VLEGKGGHRWLGRHSDHWAERMKELLAWEKKVLHSIQKGPARRFRQKGGGGSHAGEPEKKGHKDRKERTGLC